MNDKNQVLTCDQTGYIYGSAAWHSISYPLYMLPRSAGYVWPKPITSTLAYTDLQGADNLTHVYALFNSSLSPANGCYVAYVPQTNQFFLKNDQGTDRL